MKRTIYSSYKATNEDWLGDIPSHWEVKPLKRVSSFNDEVLPESTEETRIINYVEIGDVSQNTGITGHTEYFFGQAPTRARRVIKTGDTLVSTVRTYLKAVGTVGPQHEGFIASTGFCVLRPSLLYPQYQSYVCLSRFIEEVSRRSVGVSYPAINATDLVEIKVPYPPTTEQRVIAAYLDEKTALIDETIRKKQRLIELLQEERTALINQAVTKGLEPQAPMKDSGVEWLGKIPQYWEVKKLKYLASKVLTGSTPPTEESSFYDDGDKDWYSPGDFTDDFTLGNSRRKITNRAISSGVKVYPPLSVLLVGIGATLGKSSICLEECSSNQQINAVIFNAHLNPWYGLFFLRTVQPVLKQLSNTATLAILNQSQIKDILVTVPPLLEQVAIVHYIKKRDAEISQVIKQSEDIIALLSEYRTSLINEVVTGNRCVLSEEELEKMTKDQELVS